MRTPLVVLVLVLALAAAAGPAAAQGFHAEYYAGLDAYPTLRAPVAAVRVDPAIAFSDTGAAGTTPWRLPPGVGPHGYTVRWTATFTPPAAGAYGFTLTSADAAVLSIDGAIAIDRRHPHSRATDTTTVTLTDGPHVVELYYAETGGERLVALLHTPPGGSAGPIPPAQLSAAPVLGPDARRVGFDELATGTFVTDQLLGAAGVRFATDHDATIDTYTTRPKIFAGAAFYPASSAPHQLHNDSRGIEAYEQVSGGVPLTIAFTRPQRTVTLRAGRSVPATVIGAPTTAILSAYDATGALVASDRVDALPTGASAPLAVARGRADITTVTLDYGTSPFGELIDDLAFDTDPTAVATVDGTRPAVTILAPTDGATAYVPLGGVALRVAVREDSGVISSVVATGGMAPLALLRTATTDPACAPPTCAIYEGSPLAAHGPARFTVTARDGAGNDGTATVALTVVQRTAITVLDQRGPVAGAELFIDGVRYRATTDAAGRVDVTPPVRTGQALVARARVFESAAVRGGHEGGGDRNWNFHVYTTSQAVNLDGTVAPMMLTDPIAAQTLRLERENAVIGLHLVMSVEWDASQAELDAFRDVYTQQASDWLYDATDGQMVVERLELLDHARRWDEADFRIYTDWTMRANVNCRRGGFLGDSIWCGTWMHMARSNDPWVYAHEFGHYGLDLGDEYTDEAGGLCTAKLGSTDPTFGAGTGRQACLMAAGGIAKLCSGHPDNPHVTGTRQGDVSCWSHVATRYRDVERHPGFLQRWFLRARGGQVDRMQPMPPYLRVTAPALDNQVQPGLCPPFRVELVREDGRPAGDVEIWLRTRDGRSLLQGRTDARPDEPTFGSLTVTGVHVGDRLDVHGDSWTITATDCTPVAR